MVLSVRGAELDLEQMARAALANRTPNTVNIGNRSFGALDPSQDDFNLLVGDLEILVKKLRHPFVHDILARGFGRIWDAVRMANLESTQGYGGTGSRGSRLVINPFELRDTGSGGGFPGTNPSTTWVVNRTATGGARLYPAANTVDLRTTNNERVFAHVILGWVDPVSSPKARTVQLVWDDPWPEEVMDWDWRESASDYEMPVYELRNAWLIPPGESYRVNARYDQTGQDKLQPIGVTVKRATDLNASSAIAS